MLMLLTIAFGMAASARAASQSGPTPQHSFLKLTPDDAATREGFDHFYNMEYEPAVADFKKSLSDHPGNPYALNHLLEGVLFQELHREGKLDAALYLGNEFVHIQNKAPNREVAAQIQHLIQEALQIEDRQLAANPNDVGALYARSVTQGLRATKQALMDRAWFTALRSGLDAYNDSKQILDLDPAYSDANLVVGIYNYVVGSLPWPIRIAALLATIHGSKTKGLALIRQAVAGDGEASVDARTTLGLFLAREHHYKQALALTEWLHAAYPRSFLFALSAADLLKDAGHPAEAIQAYRQLIEQGRQGQFAGEDVGLAAMDLGNLLRSEQDWRGAAQAYDSVETFPHPNPDLVMHAQLAAGQMYDLLGDHPLAAQHYRKVIDGTSEAGNADLAQLARRFLAHPYKKGE
ncbi:MAG TPA: hypothetical protein VNJ12_00380 [Candidatus Dormibacteraeota bacterium]|nr:hypothetical protein [Candidatus Dormibacteraeota bacterium]